jgi:hypothetical protein
MEQFEYLFIKHFKKDFLIKLNELGNYGYELIKYDQINDKFGSLHSIKNAMFKRKKN